MHLDAASPGAVCGTPRHHHHTWGGIAATIGGFRFGTCMNCTSNPAQAGRSESTWMRHPVDLWPLSPTPTRAE